MSRPFVIASGFRRLETTLVAYSEIALKSSSVRSRLERLLVKQIEYHLSKRGFHDSRARRRFGRIYVEGITVEQAGIIAKIFGVASVMPAIRTEADLDSVLGLVVKVASDRILDGQSFAVRPRVIGDHTFSSQDLASISAFGSPIGMLPEPIALMALSFLDPKTAP